MAKNAIGVYAAQRMTYYCESDIMGYDQSQRMSEYETDCSQLVLRCYDEALKYYGFEGLDTSGYTGNMCEICAAAGATVLDFDGNLNDLDVGDAVVNIGNHTEMYVGGGMFGGANQDENGNISGGEAGDQTGKEVYLKGAYQYGWDKVITWCNIDVAAKTDPAPDPTPEQPNDEYIEYDNFNIAYQVKTQDGVWHEWMLNEYDTGGTSDSFAGDGYTPIVAIRIKTVRK